MQPTGRLGARLHLGGALTWRFLQRIAVGVPGDLDTRFRSELGSSFLVKATDGGRVLINNAGLASGLGEPDTFKGRWDTVRLGDAFLDPICAVLEGIDRGRRGSIGAAGCHSASGRPNMSWINPLSSGCAST